MSNNKEVPLKDIVEQEESVSESESQVLEEIKAELDDLRVNQKKILKVTRTISHEGPLPPPNQLAGYESILEGSANRIISMAENDLQHIQWVQKANVLIDAASTIGGLIAGFAIAIYGIKIGADLISSDKVIEGSIIGTVSIVGLVWVFIKGKSSEFPFKQENSTEE